MKKTLQKTLAVIMVIAMIFTQMAIMSSAFESKIASVTIVADGKLIENYDGYWDDEWDEETGEYINEYFYYDAECAVTDIIITLNDGSVISEGEMGYYFNDAEVVTDQSYDNQWGVGTHNATAVLYSVDGKEFVCEFQVEIIENPVESIDIATVELIEKTNGWWLSSFDEETGEYIDNSWYMYTDIPNSLYEYTITLKDGTVIESENGYVECYGRMFTINTVIDELQYDEHWLVGNTYSAHTRIIGLEFDLNITIVETPVARIDVEPVTVIEEFDGWWQGDDSETEVDESWFTYEYYPEYTVTLKDGNVIESGEYGDIEYNGINYEPTYWDTQWDENWGLGTHDATMSLLGFEVDFEVEVIEHPILSVTAVAQNPLIENVDGCWEEVESGRLFYYYLYNANPIFTINYRDGSQFIGDLFETQEHIGEYIVYWPIGWHENPWGLGKHEFGFNIQGIEGTCEVEVVDTTIESMTLTPVRDLIIGIDDVNYQEYLDFVAKIKFKDGSTKECLVSELQYEYDSWIFSGEDYYVEENVRGGKFEFLGYEGEYTVKFVENPYESISISGTNELEITFNKLDGTTETATILDIYGRMGGLGLVYGEVYTDIGTFPGGISYAFDEATEKEYLNKEIAISIGDMESNTLETNNWYWAFSTSKDLYGNIQYYQDMNEEFAGIDITTGDYDINDVVNISVFDKAWKYDCEYDDYYLVFDADDVQEMVENTFNISNFDVTMYEGYNSANHTIRIEQWGGYGDWAKIDYTLEYKNGKWYGTREYSTYYSDEPEYINIILNDEMLLEKISFGKEEEIDTSLNGWKNEDGKWAFYVNGIKLKNQWKADSKGWCYLGEDGYMLTNALVKDSQGVCFVGSDGYIVYNKWVQFEGKWYFIDTKGYTVTNQWRKDSSGWCYLGSDGAMLTNEWVKDSKGYCYVSATGYIVYNQWVNYDGKWYFVDANGYKVSSQWRKDSIGWCYLGSDGAMLTNEWVKDSKGYCYVSATGYIVYNQWVNYDGKWYFVDANGYKVSSQWRKDSIGWCYLGSDGAMLTNKWVKDSKGWCYVDESGYIVYNQWINDGGKSYYIDANGYMVSNKWLKDGDNWRYVGADGSCLTNQWMKDSIGWCFLDENGYMVTNAMVTDSHGVCFVGEDGYWQSNVIIDDGYGYLYFDETGYMATDIIVYDGYGYRYFDETGYMVTDTWLTIDGESVYVDSNGYLDIQ